MEISLDVEPGIPQRVCIHVDGKLTKKVSSSIVPIRTLLALDKDEKFFENLHILEVQGGKRYALSCLSRQSLHSQKLAKNLQRHFLEPALITLILTYCEENGFLDDREWIQAKVRKWQSQGKSTVDVKARLRREGVTSTGVEVDNEAALEKLVSRKYPQLLEGNTSYKEKCRVLRSLQRRGFSFDCVKEFLQKKKITTIMGEETVE